MTSAYEAGFLDEIRSCADMWRLIDLRVLALRDSRVGWRCEGLRAYLLPDERIETREDLPRHPELLALHTVWPIDRLEDLIRMLDVGELAAGSETVQVKQYAGGDNRWQPLSSYWIRTYERRDSRARSGLDWRTVVLQAYDSSGFLPNWQRTRELFDSQLQIGDPPWNGLTDLRHGFLGQPADDAARLDLKWVEVVAPIAVRFGMKSTLEYGPALTLHAEAVDTVDGNHVTAGVFVTRGDETIARRRAVFRSKARTFPRDGVVRRIAMPSKFSAVNCILTYRGYPADRIQLLGAASGTERVQWAVFGAAVGGSSELLEALLDETRGGDPFEHAVTTLLHLQGFVTAHYGRNTFARGGDLPDIVGFAPERNWLLVVECTARDLDYGAVVAKLVTRTKEIQAAVPGLEAQSVLVVRQPRALVLATASEVAIREQVAIVALEDIHESVGFAIANLPPDKIRDWLVGLIPTEAPFGRR